MACRMVSVRVAHLTTLKMSNSSNGNEYIYHPRGSEQKIPNQIPQKICRQIVKGCNIDFGGGVIQFEHNVFVLQMGLFLEKSPQI